MNYGEIKTAILNRSHRSDLTSHIPEFISLAEAEYNRRTDSSYEIAGSDSKHNWLSDTVPTVYIYGGLRELCVWTQDDEGLARFSALFERALDQAHYAEVQESGLPDERLGTELLFDEYVDFNEG
jgi:hypothetical protein